MAEEQDVTVYCPKAKEKVSVRHCLGSYVRKHKVCSYLQELTVDLPNEFAKVRCNG